MMAPTRTIRVARAAARRRLAAVLVTRLGRALLAAGVLSLLLVGAFKLAGREPPWVLLSAPVVVGVVWAVASAVRDRWSVAEAACELDQRLGLRDRLGSGLGLAEAAGRDAFAAIAVRESERAAEGVDVRAAVPLRAGNSWVAWPLVGAGVIASAMFVPALVWPGGEAPVAIDPVARQRSADELREFADRAEQTLGDDPSPAAADALDAIDRLESELLAGERTPEEARTIAAEQVGRAADELERRAREEQTSADELRDRLARAGDSESMSDLAERLNEGDLESARDAVRELMNARSSMDEPQREALRRDLEALADRIENSPAEPPSPETDPLEELGIDPAMLDNVDPTDADRTAEALENEGVDPETSRRVAEEVAQRSREERAREQAQEDVQRLSEALRDAADDLDAPPEPPTPPADQVRPDQPPRQPPSERPQQETDDQPREQTPPRPPEERPQQAPDKPQGDQERPQQGQPQEQPGQRPGNPDEPQSSPQPRPQPGQQSTPPPGDEPNPGEQITPNEQPQPAPDGQPRPAPGDQEQPGRQQREPNPADQPSADEPRSPGEQPTPDPDATRDPGQQRAPRPDPGAPEQTLSDPVPQPGSPRPREGETPQPQPGAEPTDQQRPGSVPEELIEPNPNGEPGGRGPGEGLDGLEQELDRLARREHESREAIDRSEELRRQAEEMLKGRSPEDLEQLDRWARELDRQQPPPIPEDRLSVPADLRPEAGEVPERVIAEWYGDGEAPEGAASGEVSDRVRRAADSALRAVEDQAVPVRRRDLVRRVFDRVREDGEKKN